MVLAMVDLINLTATMAVTIMCVCATNADIPGLKARITQSGLNYLRDEGLQTLRTEISQLKIPDIKGDAHVDVVGSISYTISNIHMNSVVIPSATLTTTSGVGLVLRTPGISMSASGNWHYSNHGWIPVSDSGSFEASMSGTSLALTLRIGMDKTGKPTISASGADCSFNAGNVHVKLHGGASWLYNLFSGNIDSSLESSLNDQTCKMILNEVNVDLQKQLAKLQTSAPLGKDALIDYSLVTPPIFTGYIETSHKGEVFPIASPHSEAPYIVPVIPYDPDTSRHVFIWITDYMFETAGYVYYKAGTFVYNLTQATLPSGFKYGLNTSDPMGIKLFLPTVSEMYPNMLLQIDVKATAPPAVNITRDQVLVSVNLDLDVFVTMPNKALRYLFTSNVTVHGATLLACDGSSLTWSSNVVRVDVGIKRSAIGKFKDMKNWAGGIDFACRNLLVPWLDDEGRTGILLIHAGNINFEKSVLTQGKGFIKLGTDISYNPNQG